MKYLVSRHAGALQWCQNKGYVADKVITHLDPHLIQPGDIVIGTLPLPIAAAVQQRGGRYLHLTVPLTAQMRGKELSADTMERLGAFLQEFSIQSLPSTNP